MMHKPKDGAGEAGREHERRYSDGKEVFRSEKWQNRAVIINYRKEGSTLFLYILEWHSHLSTCIFP